MLDAASGPHADTRNKAVRLIANKLFAQPQLQDSIAAHARTMLFKLTATASTAAIPAATAVQSADLAVDAEQPSTMLLQQSAQASSSNPPAPSDPPPLPQPTPSSSQQQQQQQQHQYHSEEDGTRFAGLYCALCTKQQALLRDLLLVYGRAAEGSRAAIEAVAAGTVISFWCYFQAWLVAQHIMCHNPRHSQSSSSLC